MQHHRGWSGMQPQLCLVSFPGRISAAWWGSLVYALSAPLRELLERDGQATLQLDLAPARSPAQLAELLTRPRKGQTLSSILRKRAGLDGLKVALLHECLERAQLLDSAQLA